MSARKSGMVDTRDLEREFVTRIINDPDRAVNTAIRPGDLLIPAYRAAFQTVLDFLVSGVTSDPVSVAMACAGYQQEIAGLSSIDKANFEFYERELTKVIQRKRLRDASMVFAEMLAGGNENAEIQARVEELLSASVVEHDHREIKSLYQCAMEFGPILEERYKSKGALVGITTGFRLLDDCLGGFQPGTYYIGARPSQGKTALMLTFMRAALKAGHSTGLISIESSDMELISRVLSAEVPVPASSLKSGQLTTNDLNKFQLALKRIEQFKGHLYFNTKTDTVTLENIARRMIKTHGIEILFIDYLQRINAKGPSKFEQVAAASRVVTDIAKGMGIPVVCLAQTGRIADHEAPSLNHFQYSSAIEQDADVAIVIHSEKDDNGGDDTRLCVLKNRDGGIADIPVLFNKNYVRFDAREIER
jgi:replicative DNA helicase